MQAQELGALESSAASAQQLQRTLAALSGGSSVRFDLAGARYCLVVVCYIACLRILLIFF